MSCGLTSLGAIRLRDKLNTTLQQVLPVIENQETIPATLAFDFPSTRAICNFIETNIKAPFSNTSVPSLHSYHASEEIPRTVSVVGAESTSLGCSTNRGMITSASTSTDLKGCSKDHVCIIPSSRWDLDHIATFDDRSLTPRFGTFVFDIENFDVEATGMSASEAAITDPQQRLILGACAMLWLFPYFNTNNFDRQHTTCSNHEHLAGREKSSNPCRVSSCAVLVGVSQVEYPRLAETYRTTSRYGSYDATGAHLSVIAGRVAFTLALSGPATAFDTACSSSLVAVVYAHTWLTHHNNVELPEGRESLVGGVNLILDAAWSHKCNAARMLSPDGRCKTFDSSADGYVRAEACGMVRMINEEELDKSWSSCHVVLAGAAANQDGRSSSLTAPNGPAQNEVIRDTLRISTCSSVEPVSVLQLHGTGTLLGDPIEMGAAISAFSSSESLTSSLVTGATKTTMGHSEPASGMVSIFAASTSLQCSYATSVAHLRAVNRNVAAVVVRGNLVVTVPRQVQSHTSCGIAITKSASVSAFAFQGTNAHAIISGTNHRNQGGMHSGRTEKSLANSSRLWDIPLSSARLARACHSVECKRELSSPTTSLMLFQVKFDDAPGATTLCDHALYGRALCPAAAFFECTSEVVHLPIVQAERDFHVDVAVTNSTIPLPLELDTDKVCTTRVCLCGARGSIRIESISDSGWRAHLKAHAMSTVNNVVSHGRAYGTIISRVYSRPVYEHRFHCAAKEPCPLPSGACAVVNMELLDNLNWYFGSLGTDSFSRALDAAIHLAEGTVGLLCPTYALPSPASTANGTPEPCVRVPVAAGALFCRFINTAIGMQLTANYSKQADLGSRAVNTHRLSDRIVLTSLEIRSVRRTSILS
jgi:3-oxoacyl-(acyl-carrier-protein) synthase